MLAEIVCQFVIMLFQQKNLSTQISALCSLNQQIVLVGEGQYVLVYTSLSKQLLQKIKVFTKVSVHGFSTSTQPHGCGGSAVLVWGQRCFRVLHLDEHGQCCVILPEQVAEDWIISGCWLHSSPMATKELIAHKQEGCNYSKCPSDVKLPQCKKLELNAVDMNFQKFILMTAHSSSLIYAMHSQCITVKAFDAPETAYQALERREIELYCSSSSDEVRHPPIESGNSPTNIDHETVKLYAVTLIDRVQCSDKCILFSGCIIAESNLCGEAARVCNASDENISREQDENYSDFVIDKSSQNTAEAGSVSPWNSYSWVCVGGTVMGYLIIWGAHGTPQGSEVTPWHILQVHKGVVFSVAWNPQARLLTTTSDDRLVKTWSVQDTCSPQPPSLYLNNSCCNRDFISSNNSETCSQTSPEISLHKENNLSRERTTFNSLELLTPIETFGSIASKASPAIKNITNHSGNNEIEFRERNESGLESNEVEANLIQQVDTGPNSLVTKTSTSKTSKILAEKSNCWRRCKVQPTLSCPGHDARVWRSCVVQCDEQQYVVSTGEDSRVCVWSNCGDLVRAWIAHEGASVWCVVTQSLVITKNEPPVLVLITGGGDGAVKLWPLKQLVEKRDSFSPTSYPWNDVNFNRVVQDSKKLIKTQRESKLTYEKQTFPSSSGTRKCSVSHSPAPDDVGENAVSIASNVPLVPEENTQSLAGSSDVNIEAGNDLFDFKTSESHPPPSCKKAVLSDCNSKPNDSFVRCLALVESSHCVLTLDNGQVWLWKLPMNKNAQNFQLNEHGCNLGMPKSSSQSQNSFHQSFGASNILATTMHSSCHLQNSPNLANSQKENPLKSDQVSTGFELLSSTSQHLIENDDGSRESSSVFKTHEKIPENEEIQKSSITLNCHEEVAADGSAWRLVAEDRERLGGYTTVAVAPATATVAVCGLHGDVFVWRDILRAEALTPLLLHAAQAKVVWCAWLSDVTLLLSLSTGRLLLCSLNLLELQLLTSFELPASKQRWCTAAALLSVPPRQPGEEGVCSEALLVGDRSGSIHVFNMHSPNPVGTAKSVHGSGGVTSVRAHPSTATGTLAVSSGRDGWLRYWRCSQSAANTSVQLTALSATRHGGATWVAAVVPWHGDVLVLSFREVHLEVWSSEARAEVARVSCGGGHRAWDIGITAACGTQHQHEYQQKQLQQQEQQQQAQQQQKEQLVVVFLKEGLPRCSYVPLCRGLEPLRVGISSKATLCGAVLHSLSGNAVVAVAGEDNKLQLLHFTPSGDRRQLLSINSHISAIRCLSVIKPRQQEKRISDFPGTCVLDPLKTDTLDPLKSQSEEIPVQEQNRTICGSEIPVNKTTSIGEESGNSVWFITGGGRAQLKIWQCSRQSLIASYECDYPVCSSKGKTRLRKQDESKESMTRIPAESRGSIVMAQADAGGRPEVIQDDKALQTFFYDFPASRDMPCLSDIARRCSGAEPRTAGSLRGAGLECSEVLNHQIFQDRPSSWRQKHVQVDAEVRHMACSGMWLSDATAIIAIASSDGSLRIFRLHDARGSPALDELFVFQWPRCLLLVDIDLLHQDTNGVNTWALIHVTDTAGQLLCCSIKDISSAAEGIELNSVELIDKFSIHKMGINAMDILVLDEHLVMNLHLQATSRVELLVTGGDDNTIVVSRLSVTCDQLGQGPETKDELVNSVSQRLHARLDRLGHAVRHSSQITGVSWLSRDSFISSSVDQRLILWKINGDVWSDSVTLVAVRSVFSAVADIHGVLVWPHVISDDHSEIISKTKLDLPHVTPPVLNPTGNSPNSDVKTREDGLSTPTLCVDKCQDHITADNIHLNTLSQDLGIDVRNCLHRIMVYGTGCELWDLKIPNVEV
ncbi:uncharacterized protein LOC108672200 [Hyalella azteca]|uniref:tRNA (34-2'-O)-methyltransferase regulator WDR6 n=1 Tax=Hyalella azteca TaxID=294128 RepID=A0A8B7NNP8_HYAAZ|nr:uncharacterized protein LOC108672200 [Hyalella azteca]